jgi:uncharacterized membrane protein YsdA (DUF1294 family)
MTLAVFAVLPLCLVLLAIIGFALFWVDRLGVRFGLRDHRHWLTAKSGGVGK